jgi:signal transduction histidine kinase
MPRPLAVAALRIADEALTNVVRHSSATSCTVQLRVGDCLELVVSDDGVGPGEEREGGVGLGSMRQRAARLGGSLAVRDTRPGTRVCARLPLAVEAR